MEYIPNILGKISFSIKSIADLVLFLVATFTAIATIILFFHWKKYGMGGVSLAFAELIYLVVSVVLIVVAFLAIN